MKNMLTTCLLVAALAALGVRSSAQTYQWALVTQDQAVEAVQNFEGNQSLSVAVTGQPWTDMSPPGFGYTLTAGRYQYTVGAYSLDWFERGDTLFLTNPTSFYGGQYTDQALAQLMMTQAQAQQIANSFMLSHYPEPSILQGFGGGAAAAVVNGFNVEYSFTFYQTPAAGVVGPSYCKVFVDSVMGQVVQYISVHVPLLVSPTPSLTAEQAAQAAISGLGMTNADLDSVIGLHVSAPDPLGAEALCYTLTIGGLGPPDFTNYRIYMVAADANSGAPLEWDISSGLVQKKGTKLQATPRTKETPSTLDVTVSGHALKMNAPLLLIGNRPFIYAGYLCYGDAKAKLHTADKTTFAIQGGSRTMAFRLDSIRYTLDGEAKELPAEPVMVAGRPYVPLDVFNELGLSLRATYDAKTRTVRFDCSTAAGDKPK